MISDTNVEISIRCLTARTGLLPIGGSADTSHAVATKVHTSSELGFDSYEQEKRIFFVQLVDIHGNKKSDDKPEKVAAMIEYKEESDGSLHALEANMIDVEPAPNGQYQVSWQGRKIGSYFIHVKLDGQPVSGSPFKAEMTRGELDCEQRRFWKYSNMPSWIRNGYLS